MWKLRNKRFSREATVLFCICPTTERAHNVERGDVDAGDDDDDGNVNFRRNIQAAKVSCVLCSVSLTGISWLSLTPIMSHHHQHWHQHLQFLPSDMPHTYLYPAIHASMHHAFMNYAWMYYGYMYSRFMNHRFVHLRRRGEQGGQLRDLSTQRVSNIKLA